MLNRIFTKTACSVLPGIFLGTATLLGASFSPAHAYHGFHHRYWHHHSFGHSFGRGLGLGVGMGIGYGVTSYAFGNMPYGYRPYYGYGYNGYGYDSRPVVNNSQTIIYNAPPPPPAAALPPAYPYPVPGYTTYNPGYGYTAGPITAPPNF